MKLRFFKKLWVKMVGVVILGLIAVIAFFYFQFRPAQQIVWGLNFSPDYARYLGSDPVKEFSDVLTDLKPAKVRLTAYWEDLEPQAEKFDFKMEDQLLQLAEQQGTAVTLVVGRKQPRWPECHQPDWVNKLSASDQRQALLEMLKAAINHFKFSPAVERWQVENEPYFNYGENCPTLTPSELQQEVSLVRSLDSRPVVLTDSGEKGWWLDEARLADIFGSTMYRKVNNPKYGGYITYPLPPAFYRIHAGFVLTFTPVKKIIGVELQAEPWLSRDIHDMPVAEQLGLMNPQIFRQYTDYARRAGFSENYLWGTEWWYWLKTQKNDDVMWQAAHRLFNR